VPGILWQNNVFDRHDRAPVAWLLTPDYTGTGSWGTQFLHFDVRGTNFMFTSGGHEVNAWTANPDFGMTGMLTFPDYAYAGYRFDDATQLYYLRNRYYAPYLGRFLSPDPVGMAAGINMYAYAGNDPINSVDPSGLAAEAVVNFVANNFCLICSAQAGENLPSTLRYTAPGETFYRYETDASQYSKIGPNGSVAPNTYAAPATEGVVPQDQLGARYNLPDPSLPRTQMFEITPPAGTPIIGPRPVVDGTGYEVIFPQGAPAGSVTAPPTIVPETTLPSEIGGVRARVPGILRMILPP
jgi:RHS repeat-associated protein